MRVRILTLILFVTPLVMLFSSCQKKYTTPDTTQLPDNVTLDQLQQMAKTNLWASYTFSKGSFTDQSGNNHNLTPSSGVKPTYDLVGNNNEAIELSNPGDYITINDGKDFPDGDFSVCFTVMPATTSGTIFGKGDVTGNKGYSFSVGFNDTKHNNTLLFATNKTSDPCSNLFNINTETTAFGTRTISPGAWYYVCIVYQNGEEHLYINNFNEVDLKTPSNALQHCKSAPFYIGLPSATGIPGFTGKIDNLRIYTRAISAREVQYFYWGFK
jgi:hypothetical protein